MAGSGAFRLLPSVPPKVALLNPKPALDLGDGDCSSCPEAVIHGPAANRVKWMVSGTFVFLLRRVQSLATQGDGRILWFI